MFYQYGLIILPILLSQHKTKRLLRNIQEKEDRQLEVSLIAGVARFAKRTPSSSGGGVKTN